MARSRAYKLEGSIFGKFNGTSVYYLGSSKPPSILRAKGKGFPGLKHILEVLEKKFKKFTLTFTPAECSIVVGKKSKPTRVRLSVDAIKAYTKQQWDANRQLKLRLARQLVGSNFPKQFPASGPVYERGAFAEILGGSFDPTLLAPEDRAAITKFAAHSLAKVDGVDIPEAYRAKRDVQLLYLEQLVRDFERELDAGHDESWWQNYFNKNILYFQDNYIKLIPKPNIQVVATQFPDFAVLTSDGFLDVIEIKKPSTDLLKEDPSRHNFYWSTELAKAISQVENYIDHITKNSDAIRSILRDEHGLELRIIKPRGLIIAGVSGSLSTSIKKVNDFRLLNEGLKNIQVIPFDDLSRGVRNTMGSIERLSAAKQKRARTPKAAQRGTRIRSQRRSR